jgi:hypothetical protein
MFATRLAGHPRVVYDTSCFSTLDVVELFARVPAERIVFGSDVPYGRPVGGLFQTMRSAAYAGLDAAARGLVAGRTISALLDGRELAAATPPRIALVRPMNGGLVRVSGYLLMAFAAAVSAGPPPHPARALMGIQLARAVCRDPEPGEMGPALERIDSMLAAAERLIAVQSREHAFLGFALMMAARTIAATERVTPNGTTAG